MTFLIHYKQQADPFDRTETKALEHTPNQRPKR